MHTIFAVYVVPTLLQPHIAFISRFEIPGNHKEVHLVLMAREWAIKDH